MQTQTHGTDAGRESLAQIVTRMMVTMMQMDDEVDLREYGRIVHLVARRFGLDPAEVEACVERQLQPGDDAPAFDEWARRIKSSYSRRDLVSILSDVWAVAEADGHVDYFEERYMSRLATLLGVSSREVRQARAHAA